MFEKDKKLSEKTSLWFVLSLAWELGYLIAIPIVVLALLGRYLDRRFDSSPWLLLTGIFFAFLISSWAVYFKIIKIFAELEKSTPKKKEDESELRD